MTGEGEPMQFAGCYVLTLYCNMYVGVVRDKVTVDTVDGVHSISNYTRTFTGETYGEAARAARAAGWAVFPITRLATCPLL
jgi:hypothetical protein